MGYSLIRNHSGFTIDWVPHSEAKINLIDLLVRLETLDRPEPLFFLQLGANDGRQADWLYPLVSKYNLKGILIEPLPSVFTCLRENYSSVGQLSFENIAITADEDEQYDHSNYKEFYFFCSSDKKKELALSGFSSLSKAKLEKVKRESNIEEEIACIQVPYEPVRHFLEKRNLQAIDLLISDIEGHDISVVTQIIRCGVLPSIIMIEILGSGPLEISNFISLLTNNGYSVGGNVSDLIAYKNL